MWLGTNQPGVLSILVSTIATPYVTDPLVDLGKPIEFRGTASHGVHVFVSAFI